MYKQRSFYEKKKTNYMFAVFYVHHKQPLDRPHFIPFWFCFSVVFLFMYAYRCVCCYVSPKYYIYIIIHKSVPQYCKHLSSYSYNIVVNIYLPRSYSENNSPRYLADPWIIGATYIATVSTCVQRLIFNLSILGTNREDSVGGNEIIFPPKLFGCIRIETSPWIWLL